MSAIKCDGWVYAAGQFTRCERLAVPGRGYAFQNFCEVHGQLPRPVPDAVPVLVEEDE